MIVVIDTNVLVSGLLSPYGKPADIIRLAIKGELQSAYDTRTTTEYKDVLLRNKFPFVETQITAILDQIVQNGVSVTPVPLPQTLPDTDDEIFLQAAIASNAEALITGNKKHFPKDLCEGIKIASPDDFLQYYREFQ